MVALKPPATLGLRHVALMVQDLATCENFYTQLLGMHVVWRPDADNVYLSSGQDNLALHRLPDKQSFQSPQRLDHIGFMLAKESDVDAWYQFLKQHQVDIITQPRTHRDDARSFYCLDPAGNRIQMIYIPNLSTKSNTP
jgi:catechol 2,3-dioxygenase-like lactoylglutathione lyase family enzyme